MKKNFIILGAGIIGLTLASKILESEKFAKIIIVDKEKEAGLHASGRNSGVIHSGIFYPTNTFKSEISLPNTLQLFNIPAKATIAVPCWSS